MDDKEPREGCQGNGSMKWKCVQLHNICLLMAHIVMQNASHNNCERNTQIAHAGHCMYFCVPFESSRGGSELSLSMASEVNENLLPPLAAKGLSEGKDEAEDVATW